MTKMMTALVLIEQLDDWNEEVTVDADMFDQLYADQASRQGFSPDEVVSAKDLLYGVMLPSGAEWGTGACQKNLRF